MLQITRKLGQAVLLFADGHEVRLTVQGIHECQINLAFQARRGEEFAMLSIGESVNFPIAGTHVRIQLVGVQQVKAALRIGAPPTVHILREELARR